MTIAIQKFDHFSDFNDIREMRKNVGWIDELSLATECDWKQQFKCERIPFKGSPFLKCSTNLRWRPEGHKREN